MSENSCDLFELLKNQINLGYDLEKQLCSMSGENIKGFGKLKARIKAEINYLEKLKQSNTKIKKSNIDSSNLKNLRYFVDVLRSAENVIAVLQKFYVHNDYSDIIIVDIISNGGLVWTKVIARNITGLLEMYKERKSPTAKSILHTINQFKTAAETNKVNYKTPQIIFNFLQVPNPLAAYILKHEIAIKTDEWINVSASQYMDEEDSSDSDIELPLQNLSVNAHQMLQSTRKVVETSIVNLDITTLLCLVSNLSNGHCEFDFKVPVLTKQASEERCDPVLPPIQAFLKQKDIYVCNTALNAFKAIVDTIGGVNEKERTKKLMKMINVIPDNPSERLLNLKSSSKINDRAKIIFGTGDSMEAITVTANIGFIRAVSQAGIILSVYEHRAVALSETKEQSAKPL